MYSPDAVTVGLATLEVNPFGPVQEYRALVILLLRLSCTEVLAQVNCPETVAVAFGAVVLVVTIAEAVLVQPFSGLVTVRI